MIVEEGKHYLYRHIRLDNNQVFYIGIGTKQIRYEYKTANRKSSRSNYWKHIIKKYGYRVDILLESDDYEFIKEKEKEFIALYGRKDLGLGTLVNLTDGGDGSVGYIASEKTRNKLSMLGKGRPSPLKGKTSFFKNKQHNEESKKKMSEAHKGKIVSEETRKKLSDINKGKIRTEEHKLKIREANKSKIVSEETRKKLSESHKGKKHTNEAKNKMSKQRSGDKNVKATPILRYSIGGLFEKEYSYIGAAVEDGYERGSISRCCRGILKQYKNKIWKYKL